uniref:Protein C3orf33 n=1 Tax=Rhabditophanes sp. KR3021 TaxID=114890 RepID=A0AC35TKC2_9BILA
MSSPADGKNIVLSQTASSVNYEQLLVRGGIIAAGLIGLGVFIKTSPTFARFNHIKKIPQSFIRNEIEMKGVVKDVNTFGTIKIEHQPLVRIPFITSTKSITPLNVKLAGIELTKEGLTFLTKDLNLVNKPITFKVVKNTTNDSDCVDVDMIIKKGILGRTNLNQDFVRRGYAKIPSPADQDHVQALGQNPAYSRLVTKLLMSEKVADKRGLGVWERESWIESVKSVPAQSYGIMKASPIVKLAILFATLLKDAGCLTINLLRQLYYICASTSVYLAKGYRKFGEGVSAVSSGYGNAKKKLQQ